MSMALTSTHSKTNLSTNKILHLFNMFLPKLNFLFLDVKVIF